MAIYKNFLMCKERELNNGLILNIQQAVHKGRNSLLAAYADIYLIRYLGVFVALQNSWLS